MRRPAYFVFYRRDRRIDFVVGARKRAVAYRTNVLIVRFEAETRKTEQLDDRWRTPRTSVLPGVCDVLCTVKPTETRRVTSKKQLR